MASIARVSGRAAFRDLWVAGTLGALFAALASNLPQFLGANYPPQGVSHFRLCVRYGYAIWLLAYFFISNLNNRDEPDPNGNDLTFDIVQSIASLGALYWMGFVEPGHDQLLDVHFSSALIAVNLAVAIICLAALLLLRTVMKTRANILIAIGLLVALLMIAIA